MLFAVCNNYLFAAALSHGSLLVGVEADHQLREEIKIAEIFKEVVCLNIRIGVKEVALLALPAHDLGEDPAIGAIRFGQTENALVVENEGRSTE